MTRRERKEARLERRLEWSKKATAESGRRFESKAAGIERQLDESIFSDDSNAIEALEARIAGNEALRNGMKSVNKAWAKLTANTDRGGRIVEAFEKAGVTPAHPHYKALVRSVDGADYHGGKPFPTYCFSNASGRIRKDKERIEEIKQQEEKRAKVEAAGGLLVEIVQGSEYDPEPWALVSFDDAPGRAICDELKAAGFWYSKGTWAGKAANLPERFRSCQP